MNAPVLTPVRRPGQAVASDRPYLRRTAWVLVFAVGGLVAGVALGSLLGTRSVGRAVVLLSPLPGNAFSNRAGNTQVDLKTDSQLAVSDTVLERVAADRGGDATAESMRRRVAVKLVANAEVIVITFGAADPDEAMDGAQRVAEATLAVREEKAAAAYADRADILASQLAAAEKRFVDVSKKGRAGEGVPILSQRIVSLRSELREVTAASPSAGAVLATSAPRQPAVRKLRLALVAASVLVASATGYWLGGRPRRGGLADARRRRAW